jgi:enoyl-CoA hydratase
MTSAISSTSLNGIVTITIDRAPVNALPPTDWAALRDVVTKTNGDIDVRAIVLDGGQGRFCAGADIRVLTEPSENKAMMLTIVAEACQAIRSCRVPVIAAIDGPAHGGGLELALACDIRIASPSSTFSASGVNMGLVASVQSLVGAVGDTRARLMLFTGERFDAKLAEEWSLITLLADDAHIAAQAIAETVASKAPLAIEANKAALSSVGNLVPDEHDALMTQLFADLASTDDHQEAINAFLEKRPRNFTRE